MHVPPKQALVLERIAEVRSVRKPQGRITYVLDGKDFERQIISLAVRGLIEISQGMMDHAS
jgi:hypothetical protein